MRKVKKSKNEKVKNEKVKMRKIWKDNIKGRQI